MKLPYVVAFARQILDPKQTIDENMRTGRLPKVSDTGTLYRQLISVWSEQN
jgi:hypothetical protein